MVSPLTVREYISVEYSWRMYKLELYTCSEKALAASSADLYGSGLGSGFAEQPLKSNPPPTISPPTSKAEIKNCPDGSQLFTGLLLQ